MIHIVKVFIMEGRIFSIFKEPKDIGKLLIFGILGIALAQYTYFRAIAISGVGVATVLQYVAPTMIIIYLFLRYFKKPSIPEVFCILLAMVGTVCIVMQEGLDLSSFNEEALFWGLVSAASICVYTLQPIELLKTYGTTSIVGFAMFICGILSVVMFQQFESEAIWDGMTWLGNEFTLIGIFGMICIIATVFIIAWDRQRQIKREVLKKLNKEEIA